MIIYTYLLIFITIYYLHYKITRKFYVLRRRYNEIFTTYIGRILLCIPAINKLYRSKMDKIYENSQQKIIKQLSQYPKPINTIPYEKLSSHQIINLITTYENVTLQKVASKHISGTIYSDSLHDTHQNELSVTEESMLTSSSTPTSTSNELTSRELFSRAFDLSYLWNSLHQDEFETGIERQVVSMVGDMFGSKSNDNIAGVVTSGGTESLMCAMRAYRNYGMREKGHWPNESVIIAPDTVHAAIIKAGEAYNIKVILIPTDEHGYMNINRLRAVAAYYSYELVAFVASAPCYSTGIIDPIDVMAELAKKYNCGLHVDCCLGGFVINFLDFSTDFLSINGVTSLSADTHKNGHAPKGSSVLVTKRMKYSNKFLIEYSIYAVPNWKAGLYGTPKDGGSTSIVPCITSFVSMLNIGKKGYIEIARKIQHTVKTLASEITNIDDFIVLGDTHINVVAWKMNPKKKWWKGFIYVLAHEMSKRNVIVNAMGDDNLHFCITHRSANDTFVTDFMRVLKESLEVVKNMDGTHLSGDAGLYCSLESALTPAKSNSWMTYFENIFWGVLGMYEGVRMHFMGLLTFKIN